MITRNWSDKIGDIHNPFHHLKNKKCKSVYESLKITYHCQKQVLLCYTDYIISTTTYCHKTIQNGIDLSTYHQLQMSSSTIRKNLDITKQNLSLLKVNVLRPIANQFNITVTGQL